MTRKEWEFHQFERAWREHVRQQHRAAVLEGRCPHRGCNQRHDPPSITRADLIERGLVWTH